MDRNETIKAIRDALKHRSGKSWSVTGGSGTAYGWITIDAPLARRTWGWRLKVGEFVDLPENYEEYDSGQPNHHTSPAERTELANLLGLDRPVHLQGVSIPASSDYHAEYLDRAAGRTPAKIAEPYWD